jgi:hypothetical protein
VPSFHIKAILDQDMSQEKSSKIPIFGL